MLKVQLLRLPIVPEKKPDPSWIEASRLNSGKESGWTSSGFCESRYRRLIAAEATQGRCETHPFRTEWLVTVP